MDIWYNGHDHARYVEGRLNELRRRAQQDSQARQVGGPHPLRRQIGRLLIGAGEALVRQPVTPETACFENG